MVAVTGEEGLAYSEWGIPNVVITDLFVPGTGSLEVVRTTATIRHMRTNNVQHLLGCILGSRENLAGYRGQWPPTART